MRRLRRIELPLRRPIATQTGTMLVRQGVLLESRLDGVASVAEVTPHPDVSTLAADEVYAALEPWATGDDVLVVAGEAAAGIGWVRLDHDSRSAQLPAAALLAEDPAGRVLVNGLIGMSETAVLARSLVDAGFMTIKVKIGADAERELDRIKEIAAVVGEGVALRIDAGGSWDTSTAVRMIDAVAAIGVEYVEDPLELTADWSAVAGSPVPLAIDSNRPTDIQLDVVDVLVIKPSLTGPDAAMGLAERARDHGADVVVTSIVDGAIGVAAALQIAAALPVTRACGLGTSRLLVRDVADPPPIQDGSMKLPGPGIGVVLSADRLSQAEVTSFSTSSKS